MTETDAGGFSIRYTGRFLAVLGSVLIAGASFTSFTISHYLDLSNGQQRQNDQIEDLGRRIGILEEIAKINSEGRVETKTKLETLRQNQDELKQTQHEMLDELRIIKGRIK